VSDRTLPSGAPLPYLDGDMRPRELIEVLEAIPFRRNAPATLELDRDVRDFLLHLLHHVS
jgi:hypothetical protein